MTPSVGVRSVGVDLADVSRVARALERTPGLADRLFTAAEQARLVDRGPEEAARLFSVKEAVMKALGRGLDSLAFTDIEIGPREPTSTPVVLFDRAAARAEAIGITRWTVDVEVIEGPLGPVAVAEVVAECAVSTSQPR